MSSAAPQSLRPQTPPALWSVPFARNANFTGRDQPLRHLRNALCSSDPYQHTQVICGLGGVGKTQLALEYACRHRDDYAIVWWIRAEEPTTLLNDFLRLAPHLGGEAARSSAPEVIADAIRRALDRRSDWLLIFDNAQGPHATSLMIPQNRSGHVLITSRNPNWRGVAHPIPLSCWDRSEAVEFLRKRTGDASADGSADRLAEALGDLPLALEQAGACIEQAHLSFADYLERFETHRQELLQLTQPGSDYPDTVATTWDIAFSKIQTASPSASNLLNLSAFLCPDEIPRDLLARGKHLLPSSLAGVVASNVTFDGAIASLLMYSLIDATDQAISLHRLVAAVTRDRLAPQLRSYWAEIALRLVNDAFAFESLDVGTWGQCSALLPHVMAAASHAQGLGVAPEIVSGLLNEAGRYLLKSGRFAEARDLLERALATARTLHGEKHPAVSAIVNNLGRAHMRLGNLNDAKHYFEWALAIDEPAFGHHPHVAAVVNNYGLCLMAAGDTEGARQQFQWALNVYEAHHGPGHPKVASTVNNLGYALKALGHLDLARVHFQRALAAAEDRVGPSHPTVASILHNLGATLRLMKNPQAARPFLERALAIDEAAYAPAHPDVIRDIDCLGEVLKELADLAAARTHYHRALINVKRLYGGNHPRALALTRALEALGTPAPRPLPPSRV